MSWVKDTDPNLQPTEKGLERQRAGGELPEKLRDLTTSRQSQFCLGATVRQCPALCMILKPKHSPPHDFSNTTG